MSDSNAVYYINRNAKKEGPYTLEELGGQGIEPTTRIFKPGLKSFFNACEIQEINERYFTREAQAAPKSPVREKENVPEVDLGKNSIAEAARRERERRRRQEEAEKAVRQFAGPERPYPNPFGPEDNAPVAGSEAWSFPSASPKTAETGFSPDEPKEWYVIVDGATTGPFSMSELKGQGLTMQSKVWRDGMTDWIDASLIPEISPFLSPIPPLPPQVSGLPLPPQMPGAQQPEIFPENSSGTATTEMEDYGHPTAPAVVSLLLSIPYAGYNLYYSLWTTRDFISEYVDSVVIYYVGYILAAILPFLLAICSLFCASKAKSNYFKDHGAKAQRMSGAATAYGVASIIISVLSVAAGFVVRYGSSGSFL